MYSLNSTIQKEGWGIKEFLDFAKESNVDGVELLDIYWDNEDEEIDWAYDYVKKQNLVVSAYDITNDFVKDSERERQQEVQKVIDSVFTAKKLGTNVVRVFCGDLKEGYTYEDGKDWIIDGLKEAAKVAEKEQVYLAIENHGLLAGRSEQVQEIIKSVDSHYVRSTFDTGNFLLVHESPTEAFKRLKQDIVHVHFKDFRTKAEGEDIKGFKSLEGVELIGVVPGDGQVDLDEIVSGLKENQYDGWLSIEYEGKDDAKESNLEAVRRLRQLLQ